MRYFLLVSLFLVSCGNPYKHLIPQNSVHTIPDFQPQFKTELYRCIVDGKFLFKKFHLSGLMYLKNFSDSSTRVVFQNEMGITYFDFGWNAADSFQVYYIIDEMNRPALIKTLRKDFELLLFKNMGQPSVFLHNSTIIYQFDRSKSFAYYYMTSENSLKKIEEADNKRKVISMKMTPPAVGGHLAENILIEHLRANFSISLNKINQDVIE